MANLDFFGIELTDDKVRLAQISGAPGSLRLDKLFMTDTNSSLLDSESTLKTMAEQIRDAHKRSGITSKNCVVAIPERLAFSRLIVLPRIEPSKLNEAIAWAIKPLLPTDLESVNISFIDVSLEKSGNKEEIDWYAVAAPKVLISKYVELFRLAGLNLLAVETESLALSRFIWYNYRTPALDQFSLDLGKTESDIVLSRNGITLFAQSIGAGTEAIDRIISTDFSADDKKVSEIKRAFTKLTPADKTKILNSLDPVLQVIASEVSRTMVYYKQKIKPENLTTLFVSGIDDSLGIVNEYLSTKLGIKVVNINPVNKLKISQSAKKFALDTRQLSSFNVTLGLAMKGYV